MATPVIVTLSFSQLCSGFPLVLNFEAKGPGVYVHNNKFLIDICCLTNFDGRLTISTSSSLKMTLIQKKHSWCNIRHNMTLLLSTNVGLQKRHCIIEFHSRMTPATQTVKITASSNYPPDQRPPPLMTWTKQVKMSTMVHQVVSQSLRLSMTLQQNMNTGLNRKLLIADLQITTMKMQSIQLPCFYQFLLHPASLLPNNLHASLRQFKL